MPSSTWLLATARSLTPIVLCLSWLLCSAAPAAAAPPPFDVARLVESAELHEYVSALKDPEGTLTLSDVRRAERAGQFTKVPRSMTFGFTTVTLWLRLAVVNSSGRAQPWLLEASYPMLDYVTLHVVHPDGRVETRETGDMLPFSTRDVADPSFGFDLKTAGHEPLTYYLRVQTSGSLRVPLIAWKKSSTYLERHYRQQLTLWLFYGALSVMVLFNFGVYMLIRQREYLVYCALLIVLWAVQFLLAGHGAQFLLSEHPRLSNQLLPISIAALLLLIPTFARESLGQFSEFKRAERISGRAMPLAGIVIVFACVTEPAVALRIVLGATLLIGAAAPFLLHVLRRPRNPQLRLYFASWYVLAVAALVFLLRQANLIPSFPLADWSIHIGITIHGVITSLALATRLKIARDQLGLLNGQLSSNVMDLKLALARAEQATDEARRATQVKDEFMATMSHELRTPLNAIINVPQGLLEDFPELAAASCEKCGARFLLDGGERVEADTPCGDCGSVGTLRMSAVIKYTGEPAHTARFLRKIERSGKHLLQMVNGVLDFSKMEAGRLELSLVDVNLEALLREVVDEMGDLAQRKGLQLTLTLESDRTTLLADPLRLKQVLFNLLTNAIKFSESGRTVSVGWRSEGDAELFSVTDQGIGIAPENHERIFTSFEQVHKGDTRKYGGTGLGLSISRSLVRMHGGELWVESKLGQGSTFWFSIPRTAPARERSSERSRVPSASLHVS